MVFGYFKHTFDDGHALVLRLIILVAHDAVSGAAGGIRISCRAFMVPAGDPGAMSNEWLNRSMRKRTSPLPEQTGACM